ncbi:glycosyltransferase family 2 protein [Vibrio cholerae]
MESQKFLVSVIIPMYNIEKYIGETIESVLFQSLKDIEVIVVNDGSKDGSLDIAKSYTFDPRVRIISQDNKGLSEARNTGLKYSRGKYVYFLDGDDLIEKDTLHDLYDLAELNKVDLINFDAEAFYDRSYIGDARFEYKRRMPRIENNAISGKEFIEVCDDNDGFYRSSVCLLFINKSFLDENKLNFMKDIIHEDELFTFTALAKSKMVMYVPKCYFKRRIRNESIMTSEKTIKNIDGYISVAEELKSLGSVADVRIQRIMASAIYTLNNINIDKQNRKKIKEYIYRNFKLNFKNKIKLKFPVLTRLR